MKIGMITDSVGNLDLRRDAGACRAGLAWTRSNSPAATGRRHRTSIARRCWKTPARAASSCARLADHGLAISALNCSGNPLHPGEEGSSTIEVTRETIRLAGLLGVERVVMMSGCPGAPGDSYPNWITVQWPAEVRTILQ